MISILPTPPKNLGTERGKNLSPGHIQVWVNAGPAKKKKKIKSRVKTS